MGCASSIPLVSMHRYLEGTTRICCCFPSTQHYRVRKYRQNTLQSALVAILFVTTVLHFPSARSPSSFGSPLCDSVVSIFSASARLFWHCYLSLTTLMFRLFWESEERPIYTISNIYNTRCWANTIACVRLCPVSVSTQSRYVSLKRF
jgi:hypothetical protein